MGKAIRARCYLILLAFAATGLAQMDIAEYGCEYRGLDLYCLQPSFVFDGQAKFVEDVFCIISSETVYCEGAECADYMDGGCFSTIQFAADLTATLTYNVARGEEVEKVDESYALFANTDYGAAINPDMINYDLCDRGVNGTVTCTYNRTEFSMNATVLLSEDEVMFVIIDMSRVPKYDFSDFLSENWVYIILIIAIIAAVYWIKKR